VHIGNLVKVIEVLGCHTPPQNFREHGMGIVVDILETQPLYFEGIGDINLGDDIVVALATGETKKFCIQSVHLIQ
tara:strand:- start:5269 stop:5493 length:225 start_codon:yes stop_codon:yes gene_type:complete